MEQPHKISARNMILLVVASAVFLLWMDSWSHSLPMMFGIAVLALVVFLMLRNSPEQRELTHYEKIELERQSAHRWMATRGARPEDEARDNRPKLELIQGGKASEESEEKPN